MKKKRERQAAYYNDFKTHTTQNCLAHCSNVFLWTWTWHVVVMFWNCFLLKIFTSVLQEWVCANAIHSAKFHFNIIITETFRIVLWTTKQKTFYCKVYGQKQRRHIMKMLQITQLKMYYKTFDILLQCIQSIFFLCVAREILLESQARNEWIFDQLKSFIKIQMRLQIIEGEWQTIQPFPVSSSARIEQQ